MTVLFNVERYLDLLTKVFILFKVQGFSRNLRKEIVKTKRWYFYDNGIRNAKAWSAAYPEAQFKVIHKDNFEDFVLKK